MGSDRPIASRFQFTIGRAMIAIALFGVALALAPSVLPAVAMCSMCVVYYVSFHFLRGLLGAAPSGSEDRDRRGFNSAIGRATIVIAVVAILLCDHPLPGLASAVMLALIGVFLRPSLLYLAWYAASPAASRDDAGIPGQGPVEAA